MDDDALLARLTAIFRDVLGDGTIELTPASSPDALPAWDSLAQISLAVEAECRFGIAFEASEIEAMHDVGALMHLIRAKSALPAA